MKSSFWNSLTFLQCLSNSVSSLRRPSGRIAGPAGLSMLCAATLLLLCQRGLAADPGPTGAKRLGIGQVSTNAALSMKVSGKGRTLNMGVVVSALQKRLQGAFVRSGKFKVVEWSDLNPSLVDITTTGQPGIFKPKTVPKAGNFEAPEYVVTVTIDHFVDSEVEQAFVGGSKGYRRTLEISGVAEITNLETGEKVDTVSVKAEKFDSMTKAADNVLEKEQLEGLVPDLTEAFSQEVARVTTDAIYPIVIMRVEEKEVTISRGEKSGMKVGEVLKVLGPATVEKDPDTGEQVKIPGTLLGEIKITMLDTRYNKAEVVSEKKPGSIIKGAVVKRQPSAEPAE